MSEFRTYLATRKMRLARSAIHFNPYFTTSDEKEMEVIENSAPFRNGGVKMVSSSLEGDEVRRPQANFSRPVLEGLPRAELMAMAKTFGVKTFGVKSVEIIDELMAMNKE